MIDKEEFDHLKAKYNNREMNQCNQLYKQYKSNGVFKELDIDPKIMERIDAYFTYAFSKFGSTKELLAISLADENDPRAFMMRKEASDVIRHIESYLKMAPY